MKLFCKDNHWIVKEGNLLLSTPTDKHEEIVMRLVAGIEARLRLEIYDDICNIKLLDNRKAITKAGIENVALTVQAMCADIVLQGRKQDGPKVQQD